MVLIPSFLASPMAASITAGAAPRNLMPSAPFLRTALTQLRASSGELMVSGNSAYTLIRGAAISPLSLRCL